MLGKIAGAGSEVFGVQMKQEKQTDCLAAHLGVRWACQSPFPAGALLLWVPEGARVVGGGRGNRRRDDQIYFLRRPHSPRPSSLFMGTGWGTRLGITLGDFKRCHRRKEFSDVPVLLKFRL